MSTYFTKTDAPDLNSKSYSAATDLFPLLAAEPTVRDNIGRVLSRYTLKLPKQILLEASDCVRALHNYAHSAKHIDHLRTHLRDQAPLLEILNLNTHQDSLLMAYDFHVQLDGSGLELIEINTNASGYLYSLIHAKTLGHDTTSALKNLKFAFSDSLNHKAGFTPATAANSTITESKVTTPKVAIVDENIRSQKMFFEFLMYQDFLTNALGYKTELVEASELAPENYDFIYNRLTDFYFEAPTNQKLRAAYFANRALISPHPREYLLLADKERLHDFSAADLSKNILPVKSVTSENADEMWEQRKQWFFKPLRSFGAKGAYKGSSVSRKVFERITQEPYLAQKFSSPGEIEDWKFDLRFFVYKDEIHHCTARIYKGQVTGFHEAGSGFATVLFH